MVLGYNLSVSLRAKYITPPMRSHENRKAKEAIRVNRANSFAFGARAGVGRDLDSPLTFISVSASDSDAAVEARVEDLNLEDIFDGIDLK